MTISATKLPSRSSALALFVASVAAAAALSASVAVAANGVGVNNILSRLAGASALGSVDGVMLAQLALFAGSKAAINLVRSSAPSGPVTLSSVPARVSFNSD